ncbi:MAG TPA: hypothetical protein VMW24_20170 [Sedimentisphaerales bacterium]|jgi:hypothetical protein|nr:hypothetical protein [Sedimentisphaerales bacterium]
MAKKRTGLQSNIASIFSGVPIPKKGQPGTPAKPDGSDRPKLPAPQPRVPAPPSSVPPGIKPLVQPIPEIPSARVPPAMAPERKISQVPSKIRRRKKARASGPGEGVSSTRQKVSIALVLILSVLLFVVLAKPFGAPRSGPVAPDNIGPAVANVLPRANVKIDWPVPDLYPADLRDPMASGTQEEIVPQTPNVLIVKGITYSEERRFAVIGTQTVQEGDTVEGTDIKIIRINPDNVEFEKDGERWTQKVEDQKN